MSEKMTYKQALEQFMLLSIGRPYFSHEDVKGYRFGKILQSLFEKKRRRHQ